MKIGAKNLEFANCSVRNKPLPIPFYMPESGKKLSPSIYQTYRLRSNPKVKNSVVYNLVVKYYKVGTPEEWLQFMEAIAQVIKDQDIQDGDTGYSLVKSLLKGDALQVFKNKEKAKRLKTVQCLLNALRL
eukprot:5784229-Ditylum_brightwellii.AAC.1